MLPRSLFLFLSLYLTGCSDISQKDDSPDSWSLQAPQLISNSKGIHYSFKELEIKRPESLMSSDYLFFNKAGAQGIRLKIKTACSQEELRTLHKVEMNLPGELSIGELLPPAARLTGQWVCSFQFVASNKNGSEHFFELQQFPIEDDVENQIRITQDPSSLDSMSRVFGDEALNSYIVGKGTGLTQILCGEHLLSTDLVKRVLSLSDFVAEEESLPTDRSLLCRAFEVHGDNRVIASSPHFWRTPHRARLAVSEVRNKRMTYSQNELRPTAKPIVLWGLENQSEQPIYLAFKKKLAPEKFGVVTYYNRKFVAEPFQLPIRWKLPSGGISSNPEYTVIEVPKFAYIKFGLETPQRWTCGVWEHGFYFRPGKNTFEVLVMHRPNEISEANIIESISLNLQQKLWVGLARQVYNFNGQKAKQFGPYDEQGALPVTPKEERKGHCRKL